MNGVHFSWSKNIDTSNWSILQRVRSSQVGYPLKLFYKSYFIIWVLLWLMLSYLIIWNNSFCALLIAGIPPALSLEGVHVWYARYLFPFDPDLYWSGDHDHDHDHAYDYDHDHDHDPLGIAENHSLRLAWVVGNVGIMLVLQVGSSVKIAFFVHFHGTQSCPLALFRILLV